MPSFSAILTRALQLPSDIWQEFIFPYFSVESLGTLDTSLAFSSGHKALLQHQNGWIWKSESYIYLSENSLRWVRRRKIIITRCLVDARSISSIGPSVYLFLCSVKSLRATNFTDAMLLDQILGCVENIQDVQVVYDDTSLFDTENEVVNCLRVCNNLTSFSSDHCPTVDDSVCHALLQHSSTLSALALNRTMGCTSRGIVNLLSAMSRLRTLNLRGRHEISNDVGVAISTHCRSLTSLSLTGCSQISERTFVNIVMYCDQLTALNVSGTQFSDTALWTLAEHCPSLTELHLDSCVVSNSSLQYLFSNHTSFTKLTLPKSLQGDGIVHVISPCWGSMLELNISSFNVFGQQLAMVANRCPHLRKLDVSMGSHLTSPSLANLPRSLTNISMAGAVSDTVVTTLSQVCPQLQVVILIGCICITDRALAALSRHCIGLREVHCGGHQCPHQPCIGITDSGVLHLAAKCAQLRRLTIMHCVNVTVCALDEIRDHCPRIQVDWYRSAHILIVDDCAVLVKLRAKMLQRAGHTTEGAFNGQEGLDKIIASKQPDARPFDLVLTDVMMPVMLGTDATIRLREYEREQQKLTGRLSPQLVIGTSGMVGAEARKDALQAGMDAYLHIPFEFSELCEEYATIPRNLRPLNLIL